MGSFPGPGPGAAPPGGSPDAGPSPGASPPDFGPAQLAGTAGAPMEDPNAQANALAAIVGEYQGMEQQLIATAQQFPVAAQEVRKAVESIRAVLQKVVSAPAEAEPPGPRMVG